MCNLSLDYSTSGDRSIFEHCDDSRPDEVPVRLPLLLLNVVLVDDLAEEEKAAVSPMHQDTRSGAHWPVAIPFYKATGYQRDSTNFCGCVFVSGPSHENTIQAPVSWVCNGLSKQKG